MNLQLPGSENRTTQRFVFFDNLRFLCVAGVVLQHAGMAYNWSGWWPVTDGASIIATGLVGLFDGFLMPSLFFIAGYFAIPSIRQKSPVSFITGKLRRLGIPWLACTLFIGPVLPLIYHYTRSGLRLTTSYLETWTAVMGNALQFNIGILPPMNQVMQNNLFYQRYMWFIGVLIAFFLIFALVYQVKPAWFDPDNTNHHGQRPNVPGTLKMLFTVGLITFMGSTILIGTMFLTTTGVSNPESWFTLGNILQFRVSRIFLHVAYFILGILAYRGNWILTGRFPGHQRTWSVSFLLVLTAYFSAMFLMKTATGDLEKIYGMVTWVFLNLLTISALGLCTSLALRYWNRPTPLNRSLVSNSYNLYLSHYGFVLAFQLLLVRFYNTPTSLKYGAVSAAALLCGYLISRFLITPRPRLTLALLFLGFVAMILFVHP